MAKINRPKDEKPKNDKERLKLLEYYMAIVLRSLKIEDTENDVKWDNH
jgi:hypothetical protein